MTMKLSEHVTRAEFEYSPTAVNKGFDNTMNSEQVENAKALCEVIFEPLRAFRNKPIKISSGFRGVALNKSVGGASSSQHCKGQAIDVAIDKEQFLWVRENLNFDQLIYEFGNDSHPQWVHISYDRTKTVQRKQVLRAIKVGGKTKYIPYV